MAIRLPSAEDIQQVGVARDPGVRSSGDDFGAQIGRVMQNAGQAIQNVAQVGAQLAQQRQEAEDKIFLDTFDLEHARQTNEMFLSAQAEAPLGGEGFTQGVDQNLAQSEETLAERLVQERGFRPSKRALQAAKSVAINRRAGVVVKAQTWEHNQRVAALGSQFDETVDTLAQQAFSTGDAEESLSRLYESANAYEGVIPADALDETIKAAEETIVKRTVEGLLLADRADEAEALTAKFFGTRPPGASGGAVDQVVDRIIGVESGGDPNARNPNSSASGLGQFIDSTWLAMIRKHRPDIAQGKSAQEIIALKGNPALSREMTKAYARDNAQFLANQALPVTPGNTYLAHFLGPRGAAQVLKADPNTPVVNIVGEGVIRANPFLKGKSASEVVAWADGKMGGEGRPSEPPLMPNSGEALRLYSAIDANRKTNAALFKADLERTANDVVTATTHTGGYDGAFPTETEFVSAYGEDGLRRYQEFQDALQTGRTMYDMRTMPADEIMETVTASRPQGSGPGFAGAAEQHQIITQAATNVMKARTENPASYVVDNFPTAAKAWSEAEDGDGMQRAANASLDIQRDLGIPSDSRRVLTRAQVQEIAQQFRSQEDGGQNAALVMQSLADQWGDLWPQVFSELSEELPASTMVIGAMNRPEQLRAAEELAEATKVGAKTYINNLPSDVVTDLRDRVLETVPEFAETVMGVPGGPQTADAVRESVELLALRYVSQGDSYTRAVDRAYNDIIGKAYKFQDGYRIPREENARAISIGAEQYLSDIGALDIDLPASLSGLDERSTRAAYVEAISANGRWQTRPDEGGLDLYAPDGALVTVNGEPVTVMWDDLSSYQSQSEKAAREAGLGSELETMERALSDFEAIGRALDTTVGAEPTTIEITRDGRKVWVNIPTVIDGERIGREEAIRLFEEGAIYDMGSFSTREEAEENARGGGQ